MSKYNITIEQEVDLDEFDDDDIIDYLEEQGYTVINSAANASESAGGMDDEESSDRYQNARKAIWNITKVCRKYEDYCNTFYQELLASILGMPSYTDKEILIERLKEKI